MPWQLKLNPTRSLAGRPTQVELHSVPQASLTNAPTASARLVALEISQTLCPVPSREATHLLRS